MVSLQVIVLAEQSVVRRSLLQLALPVDLVERPAAEGFVLVEAVRGEEIAERLPDWHLAPERLVAVCSDPSHLPPGCLWLAPQLFEDARSRGPQLLKAFLSEHQADPMQGLLAQISHDMRSPLSVITTAASLIAKFSHDQQRVMRYLGLINESSGALKSLVNDILDFSRIREGTFAFTASDFHLVQLLESLVESFRLLVKQPERLTVSYVVEPEVPPFVHGDPGRLRQVLTNLMNNAVKFTEQGSIELRVSNSGGLLRFDVSDTGVGIRSEALEKIFLPYQQADDTIHAKFGGTGLGLTICQALVERMGGKIGVESEFGQGSRFWFTADLPAALVEQRLILPELRSRKIMVGAANPTFLSTSLLELMDVQYCHNEGEVAEYLRQPSCELHLLDLDLGQFDLVERVVEAAQGTPVVVITSAGQRGDVAKCQEIGVAGYLTLPVAPDELKTALALALESQTKGIITKYTAKEFLAQHAS